MSNFWDELKAYPKVFPQTVRPPAHECWVIAHRGASRQAPENTLSAFQLAIEQGADMLELDLRLSRDQHWMVFHDRSLKRTSDGEGRLDTYTREELRRIDAGSWFSSRFTGEPIPTLREVLELSAGKIMLNLEIKSDAVARQHDDAERQLLALLQEYEMLPHTMISSFNTLTLVRYKELSPKLSTALLYGNTVRTNLRSKIPFYGYQAYQLVLRTRADSLNIRKNLVTRSFVRRSKETGVRIHPFTVDSPKAMKKLIRQGVNGIITNNPERLQSWLQREAERNQARLRRHE